MYSPLADTIALSTGGTERWSISSAGVLQSNGAQTVQTSTGNLTLATAGGNGNITLAPNGTGDVFLDADTVRVGDSNANATITTNGTGDLILNTNSGTNSGSITIFDAANGNITLAPNGTGVVGIGSGSQSWTLNGSSTANLIIQDSTPTTRLTLSNAGALTSVSSLTASNVAVGVTANTINSTTGDLTISMTAATGTLNLPTGVTTGTTTDAAIFMNYDSVTTGDGIFMTADALTTGSAIHLDSTATGMTSGKLLEVTASAYDGSSTTGLVEIRSTSTGRVTQSSLLDIDSSGANASSSIEARGATIAVTNTGTTSTNTALFLDSSGATTNYSLYANTGQIAATAGSASLPTYTFHTDPNTGMYRDSVDEVKFATGGNNRITLKSGAAAAGSGIITINTAAVTGTFAMEFLYNGVNAGEITVSSANTVAYVTSSDYRLKKDVEEMDGSLALQRIMSLRPVTFKWKSNDTEAEGFIAHELQEQFPDAVVFNKDATVDYGYITDENGTVISGEVVEPEDLETGKTWIKTETRPLYQGVDTSFVTAGIVAAMQEQERKIQLLKQIIISKGLATEEDLSDV
jgi:hypothetical protein